MTDKRVIPWEEVGYDPLEPITERERVLARIPLDAPEMSRGRRGRQVREAGKRTERRPREEA